MDASGHDLTAMLQSLLDQLAVNPNADLDIAEIGLWIARDVYPDLDIPIYLSRLDDLADQLRPKLFGSFRSRIATFAEFLFVEQGFTGNVAEYYDPRNSCLNEVLDRKLGIPISLSVLAMAVGERVGLPIQGIGLPGHFVCMARQGSDTVFIDPYHEGRLLGFADCERLVQQVTGMRIVVDDETVEPIALSRIVLRMMSNLKAIYLQTDQFALGAQISERLARLVPDDLTQLRDMGVLWVNAGQLGKAISPLERYLREEPDADDHDTVKRILQDARTRLSEWN